MTATDRKCMKCGRMESQHDRDEYLKWKLYCPPQEFQPCDHKGKPHRGFGTTEHITMYCDFCGEVVGQKHE